MNSHLHMAAQDRRERGASTEEARVAARREFGNIGLVTEITRDAWGRRWLQDLADDIRYGLRAMRTSKGFAITAILTLALGIGANAAIFRVLNAAMLRELPVSNPKELVLPNPVGVNGPEDGFAYGEFEQIRDRNRSLSGMFAFDTTRFLANADGQAELVWGQCVSGNFFGVLGVNPVLGRPFDSTTDRAGQPPTIVISHSYWDRRFARDPAVIGKDVVLKNLAFRIVGVAPASFRGIELGDSVDIWVPMAWWPQLRLNDHTTVAIMGRLNPGVSQEQAATELTVLHRAYAGQQPSLDDRREDQDTAKKRRVSLRSGARGFVDLPDKLPRQISILMIAVGLVLLIACANVANLQLARAVNRKREIAVRLALGAGRLRLVRQLLTESLLLAIAGGALGLLLSNGAAELLLRFAVQGAGENGLDVQADLRVLCFTAAMTIATVVAFGLWPALGATRVNPAPALKAGSNNGPSSRRRMGAGQGLVVAQVTLCVALLVGAGLMLRSLLELSRVNPGFRKDHVLLISLYPTLGGYQGGSELNLYAQLQERIDAVPGVVSTSFSRFSLLSGGGWRRKVTAPGPQATLVSCKPVGPRFFATMGIPLVLGRDFATTDGSSAPRVVILSEALARETFPGKNALGRQIEFTGEDGRPAEVIGIARDVKSFSLRGEDPAPGIYIPVGQTPADLLGQGTMEMRTTGDPELAAATVRRAALEVDRNLAISSMSTQEAQIDESLGNEKSLTTLLSVLATLALSLAGIGLYGVVAYWVASRTREIGIRMALGARRSDVLSLVMGLGLLYTVIGAIIGLAFATVGARVLKSELFGVSANDLPTVVGAVTLMIAVALAASCLPARRALRVDPMVALRHE